MFDLFLIIAFDSSVFPSIADKTVFFLNDEQASRGADNYASVNYSTDPNTLKLTVSKFNDSEGKEKKKKVKKTDLRFKKLDSFHDEA